MFISVRYWNVPKGPIFYFNNVISFKCDIEDKVPLDDGGEYEIYKIIYNDENGSHEINSVLDFEVI